ncbi:MULTISPECIES: ABC transporter ATP-binding protein [unclassified Pseudarthrobacter]|uniref:ABC transporter ATP-binding protein n=1 Tax=unclassified Pseudarthrobacter TaxID=2647000 RepID=UPI003077E49D
MPESRIERGGFALEVEGLRVSTVLDDVDIIEDVSFRVRAGEMLGLVGESGSGKTTAALALLGFVRRGLQIADGTIRVGGADVRATSPERLRRLRGREISYVPQDPASALNPALTIGRQLAEVLNDGRGLRSLSAEQRERLEQMLAEVRLNAVPDLLRKYPHQLSGGQQQRVGIAMAFANRPTGIVLDEPTTGLDVTTQKVILETIRELCASYGVAGIYVSHDLAVVSNVAAETAVMYSGRIVELGPTACVLERPTHPYTRALLKAIPSPTEAEVLEGVPGYPPAPDARPAGCAFAPRCALVVDACRATVPELRRARDGVLVRCIRAEDPENLGLTPDRRPVITLKARTGEPVRLAVSDMRIRYGQTEVVHGVSFDARPRECTAIVGESGSGKTTLARSLAGAHSNWTGTVALDGAPIAAGVRGRDRETLRRIQYVFQNPYESLNPRRTIRQSIEQPLRQFTGLGRAERQARTLEAMASVSLPERFLNRYPEQLSGGERQRAALARAIAAEPEVLICDEVTSALDVSVQASIIDMLRRLQRERGLAIVFITHNIGVVRSIADQVLVVADGEVVEQGSAAEVLDHPQHPYSVRLLADVPKFETESAHV